MFSFEVVKVMNQQHDDTSNDSIFENIFLNAIQTKECEMRIPTNQHEYLANKTINIYSENFKSMFECNLLLAKSAFFNFYENNIENIFSKQMNINIQKELIKKYPELGAIKELLAKKQDLEYERLSFGCSSQKNLFEFTHPDADRSPQRKINVINEFNNITNEIQEKKSKINFIYVYKMNQENFVKVKDFLCNTTNVLSRKTPPAPIDRKFYQNLEHVQFHINLISNSESKTVDVNYLAGLSISKKIADSPTDSINIETDNIEIMSYVLKEIISMRKVTLKYIFYEIYKEIAEKLESKFLENNIKCFEKYHMRLKTTLEKVDALIEIQDKLFSINENNFDEISIFIQKWVQNPDYKHEIEHQISNTSYYNPKKCHLYKILSKNIENNVFKDSFNPTIFEYSFSKIEIIMIEDDIKLFQNYLLENDQIDKNKKIFYCSCLKKEVNLIEMSCFYGSLKIFKYLVSMNYVFSESEILHFAIAGGNIEIMTLLNIKEKEEIPKAREYAVLYHRNTILDWLIDNEIDNDNNNTSLLIYASKSNNYYAAKIYFQRLSNDFIEENSRTYRYRFHRFNRIDEALGNALQYNHESFFCFLLNFPNVSLNNINSNLLNAAIKSENMKSIDLILSFREILFENNIPSQNQETLLTAIKTGNIEIVNKIFDLNEIKQSIERVSFSNKELAYEIIMSENREIIQKFISYGSIFQYPYSIENMINQLVFDNNIKSIENIVDKEYFSIRKDWSPFPNANTCEMIKYLLECKSNIDYCDNNGNTCLFNAIKNENIEVIIYLLENKATVRKTDYDKASPEIKEILHPYYKTSVNTILSPYLQQQVNQNMHKFVINSEEENEDVVEIGQLPGRFNFTRKRITTNNIMDLNEYQPKCAKRQRKLDYMYIGNRNIGNE